MAARKHLNHMEKTREKIRTSMLVKRLVDHVLSEEPLMQQSQVTAALGLIKKTLPDLSNMELTGGDGGAIKHEWKVEVIDAKPANS